MYSCIYLCVLKRSGTRLYTDIMDHINQIYVNLNINIELEEAGHLPTSLEYKTHYSHCIHHVRATKFSFFQLQVDVQIDVYLVDVVHDVCVQAGARALEYTEVDTR